MPLDCTSTFSSPHCSLAVVWSSTQTGTDANRRLTLHTVRVADVHLCHLSVADAHLHKKHISLIAKTEKRLPRKRHTRPWGPTELDTSSGWEHNQKVPLQMRRTPSRCGTRGKLGVLSPSSFFLKFQNSTQAHEQPSFQPTTRAATTKTPRGSPPARALLSFFIL